MNRGETPCILLLLVAFTRRSFLIFICLIRNNGKNNGGVAWMVANLIICLVFDGSFKCISVGEVLLIGRIKYLLVSILLYNFMRVMVWWGSIVYGFTIPGSCFIFLVVCWRIFFIFLCYLELLCFQFELSCICWWWFVQKFF